MPQPLVIAYHLVWTLYGVWLPNDPRGSGSEEVRKDSLADLGNSHLGRKRIQPPSQEIRRSINKRLPAFNTKSTDLEAKPSNPPLAA